MQNNEIWALPLSPLEDIQLSNFFFNFKHQYRFLYLIMNCLFFVCKTPFFESMYVHYMYVPPKLAGRGK